jgi:peptidoglycan/LPS O-acetylase OafA/YrhL
VREHNRLRSLDALRTAAVALVIIHHWGQENEDNPIGWWFSRSGWVGVDLFFVLSGFLVSGLIFREHERYGGFDAKRFLVRRGLKIYPAFYVFLFVCLIDVDTFSVESGVESVPQRLLAEVFFVQNYFTGIWGHTWSLAVEEHFYLMLAVVAAFASRRGYLSHGVRRIAVYVAVVCVACLGMRILYALFAEYEWRGVYAPTHMRIDSLLIGVLLSYAYHFRRERLDEFIGRHRAVLLVGAVLMLVPGLTLDRSSPLLFTFGLTGLAVGFGTIMLLMLGSPRTSRVLARQPLAAVCSAGQYSYSVYLWHVATMIVIGLAVERWVPDLSPWVVLVVDVVLAFAVGIVFARLVEIPVLRIRDRWFPSRSESLAAPEAVPAATTPVAGQ